LSRVVKEGRRNIPLLLPAAGFDGAAGTPGVCYGELVWAFWYFLRFFPSVSYVGFILHLRPTFFLTINHILLKMTEE